MATSTYNSRRWERMRKHQLRVQPLCRFCEDRGLTVPAVIADHVQPWKLGRSDDMNRFWLMPLQSLCKRCHDSLKKQIEIHGYHKGCDDQGMPLDPNHPFNQVRN